MTPGAVLYLLDHVDMGGGETSFLAFIRQWLRSAPEWTPVVIAPQPGPVTRTLTEMGVEVHIIPFPLRLRRGPIPWFSPAAAWRIDALAGRLRPALIHANNFFGMFYAGLAARRRGLPLVWTLHGWFDVDRPVKRWIARLFATHAACVSDAVRQEAAKHLRRPGMTSTDYLGILPFGEIEKTARTEDLRAEIRREMDTPADAPLIGVVARFQPIKGHQYLIDALPAIRKRAPGLKVWLIGGPMFGREEEQIHMEAMARRVREEGHEDCVRFLGFRDDARRLVRALDALVIPSERESFSMVAVEGLEAGVPVVGPDGWGPREIITVPATGLRFQAGDSADLASKIVQALLKEGAGAGFDPLAGPRRVAELFTVEAHVKRTMALYRTLPGGSR